MIVITRSRTYMFTISVYHIPACLVIAKRLVISRITKASVKNMVRIYDNKRRNFVAICKPVYNRKYSMNGDCHSQFQ
jgi:hypothetical protein